MKIFNGMELYDTPEEVKDILMDDEKIMKLNIDPMVKMLLLKADKELLMRNTDLHMQKVSNHTHYVNSFCQQAGIPERGVAHDASKLSAVELFESIYFYEGTRSPIDKANEVLGWSPAFMQHIRLNDHQLENSVYINGGMIKPVEKTMDAAIETVCDFCGAAKAYLGDKFTFQGELEWWSKRLTVLQDVGTIHPKMAEFITQALYVCAQREEMIDYKTFEDIWDYIHQDRTIANASQTPKEIYGGSIADDVLNNDGCAISSNKNGCSIEENDIDEEIL